MNFSRIITHWYSINKRELPWRKTKDPYKIWLSEIMLQQTQVKQGLPYYLKFVEKFPLVFHLANASEQEVLNDWQGLGYYSRARNLHATAKIVANDLNGVFPKSFEGLLKLKGIGDYTASAIASICYGEAKAVVDGNVYRVLSRYFGVGTPINSSAGQKEFKHLADEVLDRNNAAEHNQAIMEFGAIQCKPKNPDCETCPLNNGCVALQNNMVGQLPVKLKSSKIKKRYFNYLIIQPSKDSVVIQKRTNKGIWQNMYEFPLIETHKPSTTDELIANKTFQEMIGTSDFEIFQYNTDQIIHKLSHQHLYTKFWVVELNDSKLNTINVSELGDYPTPVLIDNFVREYDFEIYK